MPMPANTKRQAHDAQCGRAPISSMATRGVKHHQQLFRNELEYEQTDPQSTSGVGPAGRMGPYGYAPVCRARHSCIGNDRHHAVIQPEHRHEHKALELEMTPNTATAVEEYAMRIIFAIKHVSDEMHGS